MPSCVVYHDCHTSLRSMFQFQLKRNPFHKMSRITEATGTIVVIHAKVVRLPLYDQCQKRKDLHRQYEEHVLDHCQNCQTFSFPFNLSNMLWSIVIDLNETFFFIDVTPCFIVIEYKWNAHSKIIQALKISCALRNK